MGCVMIKSVVVQGVEQRQVETTVIGSTVVEEHKHKKQLDDPYEVADIAVYKDALNQDIISVDTSTVSYQIVTSR